MNASIKIYIDFFPPGTQSTSLARHEADKATMEEKINSLPKNEPAKLIEEITDR